MFTECEGILWHVYNGKTCKTTRYLFLVMCFMYSVTTKIKFSHYKINVLKAKINNWLVLFRCHRKFSEDIKLTYK